MSWRPADIGFRTRSWLADIGLAARLFVRLSALIGPTFRRFGLVRDQIHFLGNYSLAIIAVSGLFVGFVLGLQGYYTLQRYGSSEALGLLVAVRDAGLPLPFGRSLEMLGQSAQVASKALGVKLGVLEPGAAADLVLTNYRPATPLTSENLAGHFLFAMGPEFVCDVMIAGLWQMRMGYVIESDEIALRDRSVEVARALYQRMASLPYE